MSLLRRSTLPNAITIGRILLAPAVAILAFIPEFGARLFAFILFVVAAVSDLWDGYLARKYGWISNFGKLMDPLADKLLLVATFVPFYILSHRGGPVGRLPFWGSLPLWVVLVIFGREALITVMRMVAAHRGVVVPAAAAGKYKAAFQNIFSGSVLLWYALQTIADEHGWTGAAWEAWQAFHGAVLASTLAIAVVLTLYSLAVYLKSWRTMVREAT
ncbi:MAG TPA: CDP-diacylglycerol--glycerol-3-phosphate 3-phosphatidyltransferase [Longimicrobiales bacterium]